MFLRKMGRRFLLLHAYRDGRGIVCQRRLGHFESPQEMHARLAEAEWCGRLERDYPEVRMNWPRLREDARRLEAEPAVARVSASRGRPSLAGTLRKLVRLAAEEGDEKVLREALEVLNSRMRSLDRPEPELERGERYLQAEQLEEAEAEFEALVWKTRLELPPRRTRLEEPDAREHLAALRGLSRALEGQGRLAEGCKVAQQRARMNQGRVPLGHLGVQLQQQGRFQEAAGQYGRVPWKYGWRHYNLASLAWQQGLLDECAGHILNGLVQDDDTAYSLLRIYRQQSPGRSQYYWDEFGKLWDEAGRGFLLAVYWDPLVRSELESIRERRVGSRELMRGWSLQSLLQRVELRMQGKDRHFREAVPWKFEDAFRALG
jgi:tetratricopeptide (TPR) repeat protein